MYTYGKPEKIPLGLLFKWLMMAFVSGDVNAGGFMACGRFVSHVTGFATWFGMDAADGNWTDALSMLSVPAFFLLGVMVSAYFTDAEISRGGHGKFKLVMAIASMLLFVTAAGGYFDVFGAFGKSFRLESDYFLLVLLCTASGLLNATITTASKGVMRSTHLTGTTTDLGIGIVRAYFGHREGRAGETYRNALRIGTIIAFALGSLVGAVMFRQLYYLGFLLPGVLVLYIANLGGRAAVKAAANAALIFVLCAPPAEGKPREHYGPFGLAWGKSPAEARSILANKVQFVEEKPADEAPYHTIDQRYSGAFAKLKTADIFLRFHKGEFFYMAVTMATADAGSATKVYDQIVRKMARVYGKPLVVHDAPSIASGKAIVENLPVQNREAVMPLFWNERLKVDPNGIFTLRDLMVRIALWDPFAAWRFSNKVVVQAFMHQEANPDKSPKGPLKPVWIFAKEDRFKAWRATVKESLIIEPRDF